MFFFNCVRLYSYRCVLMAELDRLGVSGRHLNEHVLLGGGNFEREEKNAIVQSVVKFLFTSGKYKEI